MQKPLVPLRRTLTLPTVTGSTLSAKGASAGTTAATDLRLTLTRLLD